MKSLTAQTWSSSALSLGMLIPVIAVFDGSPCCALGPKKGPCWIRGGREKFVQARQESLDLEKKEVDLIVLATLRAFRSFTHDPSVSHEVVRASIKYHYGVCKSVNLLFYSFMQLVLEG